jgi:chemotaxis protein MotB
MRRSSALLCTLTVVALAASSLSGCVSSGKYDDLKKQYDDAQAELGNRKTKIETLEQSLADAQTRAAELATQIAQAQADIVKLQQLRDDNTKQIADLGDQQKTLRTQLADLVKDRSRLKESTDQLQRALAELAQRKAEADKRVAEYRNLLARFKSLIDAGKLRVKIADGRMVLELPSDVLFDSGSAKLSKEGATAVQQVASVLTTMTDRRFQVEGHTDNLPIKTAQFPSNWELAAARALGVVKAMAEAGMDSKTLSAASFGEFHPAADNSTEKGRAENRRIEVVVVPDLSSLPGFEELQHAVATQ